MSNPDLQAPLRAFGRADMRISMRVSSCSCAESRKMMSGVSPSAFSHRAPKMAMVLSVNVFENSMKKVSLNLNFQPRTSLSDVEIR